MSLQTLLYWLLLSLTCASVAYCGIAVFAALRFRRHFQKQKIGLSSNQFWPAVSVLKPVHGADRDLEANLRSFFEQDYPAAFEILFSARNASDPAAAVVRKLQNEFPGIPSRLLLIGEPKYLNAKVHAMEAMQEAAAFELLVISDSDVRVHRDYLRSVVAPFSCEKVGLTTVISRGVPGSSIWSQLEILGMNTQFIPGVLTAWLLLGLEFALGPTMAVRKSLVEKMGGFGLLGDYLADDFVLGDRIAQMGYTVEFAPTVPDHLVFNDSFIHSLKHRLRWERSSRRSRPAGYFGQLFMHPLPLAGLALLSAPTETPLATVLFAVAVGMRLLLAGVTESLVLRGLMSLRSYLLVPVQDLLAFLIWLAAIFGKQVEWRGERFTVLRGGKLERVA